MQHVLLLVIALAGSDWNCTETDGLWDCRPARATAKAPVLPAATAGPSTPLTAVQASLPPEPTADPIEAPASIPGKASAATPREAPAASSNGAPAAVFNKEPAGNESPGYGSTPPTPGVKPEKAFIVQVGAYRQREEAERAAHKLDYETLKILPTERDGESWWVIVLGAFRTLESARTVGAEYEADTGGSYWVRTTDDLREVLAYPR